MLKSMVIDIRKFRLDLVLKMNLDFKDCPPVKDRHYMRSTAIISIIVTSLNSGIKKGLRERKCLQ